MFRWMAVFIALSAPLAAQLTREQRVSDFRAMVDHFARYYGPIDWKRAGVKVDPLAAGPWIERIDNAKSDIEFFEVMAEYAASLKDGHTVYIVPSTFFASLGFTVDLFEGTYLVDGITRARLPEARYPFQVGDEVMSIDGVTPANFIRSVENFIGEGNPNLARRMALALYTARDQGAYPRAPEIADEAAVVIKRANGETATYSIPWRKTGFAVTNLPGAPAVRSAAPAAVEQDPAEPDPATQADEPVARRRSVRSRLVNEFGLYDPVLARQYSATQRAIVGVGSRNPAFALPDAGYTPRLGAAAADTITSGVFAVADLKIGYIRIPSFPSATRMRDQVTAELRFLREESDGVILDVMRNGGGVACRADEMLANLYAEDFPVLAHDYRFGWGDYLSLKLFEEQLRSLGIVDETIAQAQFRIKGMEEAMAAGRYSLREPVCGNTPTRGPARNRDTGEVLVYGKPAIVVVDELSFSSAEIFAAQLQDTGRALVVGARTAGAGGVVDDGPVGVYSDGFVSLARSIVTRGKEISSSDLPTGPYIENIGVRPDVELDFMTRDNLTGRGKPFLDKLLEIASEHIRKNR